MDGCLLVILLRFDKLVSNVVPQLALVVGVVPVGDGSVKEALESKSTGEDGTNEQRVSVEDSRKLKC